MAQLRLLRRLEPDLGENGARGADLASLTEQIDTTTAAADLLAESVVAHLQQIGIVPGAEVTI